MTTSLERAAQAVEAAAMDIASAVDAGRGLHQAILAFERAVEVRTREQVAVETMAPGADACPVHSPTGDPCDCGHDGAADCHPKESR